MAVIATNFHNRLTCPAEKRILEEANAPVVVAATAPAAVAAAEVAADLVSFHDPDSSPDQICYQVYLPAYGAYQVPASIGPDDLDLTAQTVQVAG